MANDIFDKQETEYSLSQKTGRKRVLLINPAKKDSFEVSRLHMGLTLLGQILVSKGHKIKLIDYAFLKSFQNKIKVPGIKEIINDFEPDVIGITIFTYVYDECCDMINSLSKITKAPIILGGPHFTMFPDDFIRDKRVSYIVRGEAENAISDLVIFAKKEESPVIINCSLPSAKDIPVANLDIAFGTEHLSIYQIQLSRGCPYRCSFCNICQIAGSKMRNRDLQECLQEIIEAKNKYPGIKTVIITDDCPMADKNRFLQFLIDFKKANTGLKLMIDNVRANFVDDKLLKLYLQAGGQHICLGVESGDSKVFSSINKGESLKEIETAAELVHKYNLALGLCFVIGLPQDNFERHRHSVKFAKKLKPDYIFWNMCVPWPKTEVEKWYKKNGKIGELRNFSTLIDSNFDFKTPACSSPDFTAQEKIRAWLLANMETQNFLILNFYQLKKIILLSKKYRLYRSLVIYFSGYIFKITRVFKNKIKRRILQWKIA